MKDKSSGYTCPECGRSFWVLESAWPLGGEWERRMPPPFCPGCGARAGGKETK